MKLVDLTPEEKTGLMIVGGWLLVAAFIFAVTFAIGFIAQALDDGGGHAPSEWERR